MFWHYSKIDYLTNPMSAPWGFVFAGPKLRIAPEDADVCRMQEKREDKRIKVVEDETLHDSTLPSEGIEVQFTAAGAPMVVEVESSLT
jgi:hypothetical protein